MELNLKILAPLLQCTSINRCALFIKAKKYIYFILLHPLKNYLIFSLTSCPSLSLSLSHSTLILSQNSLNLSSSHLLSVTLLSPSIASPSQATDHRSPHCPKPPIASPSLSSLPTQLTYLPLLPTQLADVMLVCDW